MSPKVVWIGIMRIENSTVTQLPSIYWGTLSASIVCSTSLIPREKFIAISHPVTCHELGHGEGRHQAARSERGQQYRGCPWARLMISCWVRGGSPFSAGGVQSPPGFISHFVWLDFHVQSLKYHFLKT